MRGRPHQVRPSRYLEVASGIPQGRGQRQEAGGDLGGVTRLIAVTNESEEALKNPAESQCHRSAPWASTSGTSTLQQMGSKQSKQLKLGFGGEEEGEEGIPAACPHHLGHFPPAVQSGWLWHPFCRGQPGDIDHHAGPQGPCFEGQTGLGHRLGPAASYFREAVWPSPRSGRRPERAEDVIDFLNTPPPKNEASRGDVRSLWSSLRKSLRGLDIQLDYVDGDFPGWACPMHGS